MPDDGLYEGWQRSSAPPSPRVARRRRALAAGAAAFVALVVVLVVVLRGGGDERPSGPARVTLLDALSPVLSTGAPAGEEDAASAKLGVPLDRAAAQLFLVGFAGTTSESRFFGRLRVRDWGGVVLTKDNYDGPRRLRALTDAVRRTARRSGHTPPVVLAQAPGGEQNAVPQAGPPLPAAVAGAPEAEDSARAAGLALRRLGVDAVLGPVASRALAGGPWEDRGFAEEPGEVAQRAGAAVRGWQQGGVLAVPGRFPGEGAASQDPSDGPASVALGRPELEADLGVFRALGPRVVATQMSGALYAAFDGVTPATLLPDAVALLREVDPDAIAVSADLQAVTLTTGGTVADAAVAALEAGCDLLYVPGDAADQEAAFRAVVTAIRSGRVPGDRVAEALQRVAALKRAARVVRTG